MLRFNPVSVVSAARQGDMQAYDSLVRRYQERIYATVYHMTSNHEDANDLAQETFLRAWKGLPRYKDTGAPFVSWLYGIARHQLSGYYRRGRVERPGARRDQHVLRLEVAVHQSSAMCRGQPAPGAREHRHHLAPGSSR